MLGRVSSRLRLQRMHSRSMYQGSVLTLSFLNEFWPCGVGGRQTRRSAGSVDAVMLGSAVILSLEESWNANDTSGLCLQPNTREIHRNDSSCIDRDLLESSTGNRWVLPHNGALRRRWRVTRENNIPLSQP